MPRIVILSQVFPPEIHPTAVMVGELARYLAERGWVVTAAVGYPHHPGGTVYPGYRKTLTAKERFAGVPVVRSWHWTSPRRDIPARAAVFVSQGLAMAASGLRAGPVDAVLVFGPPLVGPGLGAVLARWRGAPLVNVIYDIYPDIAVETGRVRRPAVITAARWAERLQYRESATTIVLSEGLRERLVDRGVPRERVAVVPIWLDPEEIRPGPRLNPWRREQGIGDDRLVFLYAGTIGVISGARIVAPVAEALRGREDVLFLFVGEGEEKAVLEAEVRRRGLGNVRLLPFQPRECLPQVQAAADVGLVTLEPGRGRTSVPSKVLGYMAAGRPVLASVDSDSDTGREVRTQGLGIVVPPGDPCALAVAAVRLADDPQGRRRMGEAGRRRLESHYARGAALAQFEAVLRHAATEGRRR